MMTTKRLDKKRQPRRSRILPEAGLVLFIAAAAFGQNGTSSAAPPDRSKLAPKKSYTPASVRALPGLKCSLYPAGAAPSKGLTVFTDDDGYARFHAVRASDERRSAKSYARLHGL